jgi:hypothetical protein
MPHPFSIKPDLQDGYAFFVMDYVFDADTWIKGVEVSPGNRGAVHHANVYMVPSSLKTLPDGRIDNVFDPVALGGRFVTAWEPGSSPLIHPDGVATLVKKGTRFAILMHYSPSDKSESDQTSIGFYLADGSIHKEARVLYGGTRSIDLPPRVSNYEIVETREFQADATIRAFTCHMHLRGKSFAVRLRYPDGRMETAFEVPHYDVNWQQLYVLVAPIFVPKRTVVEYVATWDNSPNNPFNPDPTKNVKWGDRATDEMMDGYLNYITVHEDLNIEVKKGRVVHNTEEKRSGPASRVARGSLAESVGVSPRRAEPARPAVDPSPPTPDRVTKTARADAGPRPAAEARSAAGSALGAETNPKGDAAFEKRRLFLFAVAIGLLALFAGAGGYCLGRRNRSRLIASGLVEAGTAARPPESPTAGHLGSRQKFTAD